MSNIKLFEDKKIRFVWNDEEENWYFVVSDVVQVLTDTADTKDYIKKMRKRDRELAKGWGQLVTPLPIETAGGRQKLNCANAEQFATLTDIITKAWSGSQSSSA